MTIEVVLKCDGCNGDLDEKIVVDALSRDGRTEWIKNSNWRVLDKDKEVHIGPKCAKVYDKIEALNGGILDRPMIFRNPILYEDKKPSMEFVGDDEDLIIGFPSRYCKLVFKKENSLNNHEWRYHNDKFVPRKEKVQPIRVGKHRLSQRGKKAKNLCDGVDKY